MDRLFARWDGEDRPGVAVGIVHEGRPIYLRGYGMANLEYGVPITPATVFDIASVSKQFCAFSVLLLASRGEISLDDDIRERLPEVKDIGSRITVRHLLHHTSGIRDWPQALALAGWSMEDVISFDQILELARRQRSLNFPPGSEYTYSNTGYNLFARLVERVSGKSYRVWTGENIFSPLGMENTHFHDDHREVVKNRADSYTPDGSGGYRKAVENLTALGSSSLYTTVEDLVLWVRNFDEPKAGTREVLDRMDVRGKLDGGEEIAYAMGQFVDSYRGLRTIGHSGSWAGFRTHLVRFPEERFAVIVLANVAGFGAERAAHEIADIFLADSLEDATPPEKEARVAAPEPVAVKLEDCAGRYELASGIVITLRLDGKRLVGDGPGFAGVGLENAPDGAFAVPGIEGSRIVFEPGDGGKVVGLRATLGGEKYEAKKLPELDAPADAELEEYAGTYYSRELRTIYEIAAVEGRLVARHQRAPEVRLRRTAADGFQGDHWAFARLRFERGEDGAVRGFRLTSGERVRDVLFERGRWVPAE